MPSYIPEPQQQPIAQFPVPYGGTLSSMAAHEVPLNALYDSLNVFIREGKLRNRPGIALFRDMTFDNTPLGVTMIVTPEEKRLLALTSSGSFYELGEHENDWLLTGLIDFSNLSSTKLVDFATLEDASSFVCVIAREGFTLKQWTKTGGPAAIVVSSGTVPKAKACCVAGRRVIALIPPHTIVWSAVKDHTVWPALGSTSVASTSDVAVTVRTLSNLSFVVYKERSIHLARAQSGSDETAFAFSEPLMVEGPAGIHAVVSALGVHFYMTRNGRIAMYDGSYRPQWIADGLWFFLQNDIDPTFAGNIFGVYDHRLHMLIFVYPRKGDGGFMRGMIMTCMPFEGIDLNQNMSPFSFKGVSSIPLAVGCEMRFDNLIDRSMFLSSSVNDEQSFLFDEDVDRDDGQVFSCLQQTGLQPMPNGKHGHVTIETFVERGMNKGAMILDLVTSNGLENKMGTIADGAYQFVDLENDPVRDYKGFGIQARFFGLRYQWDSTSHVFYSGSVVHGSPFI